MATLDSKALTEPISDADPCGPDLDLDGDLDYLNFVARAEGLLPRTFFNSEGKPFDGSAIDLTVELEAVEPLLAKTRDLRLLALLAKLAILTRDMDAFAVCILSIDALLHAHWEGAHPRPENGDLLARTAAIEGLDDMPHVILPLQYAPLLSHPRLGGISYRNRAVALGEVKPREGEEVVDPATLDRALMEVAAAAVIAQRDRFEALENAVKRIVRVFAERGGPANGVRLERLTQLVGDIASKLDGIVARRDPAAAHRTGRSDEAATAAGAGGVPVAGETAAGVAIQSKAAAAEALAAIADYFSRAEPSNPALLLVRQAQQLIGKSFVDAMRILVPAFVEQAAVKIGRTEVFDVPLDRLAEYAGVPSDPFDGREVAGCGEAAETGEPADAGDADAPEPIEGIGAEMKVQMPAVSAPRPNGGNCDPAGIRPHLQVSSRQAAVKLLEQVGSFYRLAEPSSPVPWITDRARQMADRDFMSLLKDFLPESTLKSL